LYGTFDSSSQRQLSQGHFTMGHVGRYQVLTIRKHNASSIQRNCSGINSTGANVLICISILLGRDPALIELLVYSRKQNSITNSHTIMKISNACRTKDPVIPTAIAITWNVAPPRASVISLLLHWGFGLEFPCHLESCCGLPS